MSMRSVFGKPLLIALLAALASVLSGDARDVEFAYWQLWFEYDSRPASPDAGVIVSLDNGSVVRTNTPADSTAKQAELLRRLVAGGAKHVFLDTPQAAGVDALGDAELSATLKSLGDQVSLVTRGTAMMQFRGEKWAVPAPAFDVPAQTEQLVSFWYTNWLKVPLEAPPTLNDNGHLVPQAALVNSGAWSTDKTIYAEHGVDPGSITTLASRDVLAGNFAAGAIVGRDVYVTMTSETASPAVRAFGFSRVPQAVFDITAAESLRNGNFTFVGALPLLFLFLAAVILGRTRKTRMAKLAVYGGFALAFLLGPGLLTNFGVLTEIGSGLVACPIYVVLRLWEKWRRGVQLTSFESGLPNVEALAADGIRAGSDVVAVCISNFEQMMVSLPKEQHGECSRQIARRLSVAFGGSTIYDNGDGHFVWMVQPFSTDELVAQLEGLKALFAAPLSIGGQVLDTNVHFGLDRNSANKPINRIRSAIASSSEAVSKLKLYEEYGSERLAAAPWELSLHARIDDALRNGDIWLSFQPQYDLREGRISGAEALIRWTDPERGMIAPDTFILQAERAGRIDTITYWVLEQAVIAAVELNRDFGAFDMSVNLSARMVDQPGLIERVLDITDHYGFDRGRLTFEVTETFNMTNRDAGKENLAALREHGFRLSIDDFGTGYASLAYLSEIATDEIKLDKRFVSAICTSPRDRAIVANVIRLAHAMGQITVGEGVEDGETLEELRRLGCDTAQGYLIGRPVRLEQLVEILSEMKGTRIRFG